MSMERGTPARPTDADLTASTGGNLIAGGKVAGTTVYDQRGEDVGSIEDVMIDKLSGKVAYAVLSFGGFLGIGSRHYPLPWEMLHYDTSYGGYVVQIDRSRLEGAPTADDDWGSRSRTVDEYWAGGV